ncbi:MAG: cupin domain-containing protein [Candidatus Omnitrophica bacterium]|nr:cupin domain-containing protein [Candidatus Omnitrophota bacterium]
MKPETKRGYLVSQVDEIDPTPCPCGWSRRAFRVPENETASLHMVEISEDARTHYHKTTTEIYYVLEGEGFLELDGEKIPIRPATSVMIFPHTRHRAIGHFRILNIAIPTFDPEDEWFDDEG